MRLVLLGGALVTDDAGATAPLTSRRYPVALLALLATAPARTLSRGKLVGFLWPEVPETTARNRLTSCVYEVRRALGDGVVVSLGGDLLYDVDALPCDVCLFEEALAEGDPESAVAQYRGPFLDGFGLGASATFERRVDVERERLRRRYHEALEALAAGAEADGDREDAVRWWRARAADDPHDSRVAARLMEALSAAGNRPEALRLAAAHARFLEEELGTAPPAEMRSLAGRLRAAAGAEDGDSVGTADAADLPVRSVAVLPFESQGGSEEAATFAAGLHDDLLTELSRISALTVISRASVRRYRATPQPVGEIARALGVGTLVEGAVRSAGGRIRLNVQLVDARTGAQRWVERYDRELSADGIFELQAELAERIAETLEAELRPEERVRVAQEPTRDLEAYRLYVQGRGLLDQRTAEEMTRAIAYFGRAIERDPGYALAWSGLADALSLLEFYRHPGPESAPDPLEAAMRAVELGPGLGEAHASLGIIHAIRQRGRDALRSLATAVERAPSHAEAHAWLAWVHLLRGRPRDALEPARRAAELDPLAPAYRVYLAEAWLANGAPSEALAQATLARELRPGYALAHFVEGLVLRRLARPVEGEAALEEARRLVRPGGTPSHAELEAALAVTRMAAGDRRGATAAAAAIDEVSHPFEAALAHAALGDLDTASRALARVSPWPSSAVEHVRYFFPDVFERLRGDDRFEATGPAVEEAWNAGAAGRGSAASPS